MLPELQAMPKQLSICARRQHPASRRLLACVAACFCVAWGNVSAENLFSAGRYQSLVADRRAGKVGDVLTVLIYENSSAMSSADTTAAKGAGITAGLKTEIANYSGVLNLGQNSNGGGKLQRSGNLLAQITVVVTAVDSNGLLSVKGDQLIELNGEKQEIRLEGKVRSPDILENNTVLSSRVADARISYIGDGVIGDGQRPGIIGWLLGWLRLL